MLKDKKTSLAILKVSATGRHNIVSHWLGLFSKMHINLKGARGEGMLLPASYDISHAPIYCQRATEHNHNNGVKSGKASLAKLTTGCVSYEKQK